MKFNRPPEEDVHYTPAPGNDHDSRKYAKERVVNWTQIIMGIIGIFMLSSPWEYLDSITEKIFISKRQRLEIDKEVLNEKQKLQNWRDSINQIREDQWELQEWKNQNQILKELRNCQRIIEEETHISIAKARGHKKDSLVIFENVTVMYTTDQVAATDIQNDWQERPVPGGYSWLFNEIINKKLKYIPDIRQEPYYYWGNAKQYSDFVGTRGQMSAFVKVIPMENSNDYYMIVASFSTIDPKRDDEVLELKIQNLAESIKPLINKKPEIF